MKIDREAVCVSGLSQEGLCLLNIIGPGIKRLITGSRRAAETSDGGAETVGGSFDEKFLIDRIAERLANTGILGRIASCMLKVTTR